MIVWYPFVKTHDSSIPFYEVIYIYVMICYACMGMSKIILHKQAINNHLYALISCQWTLHHHESGKSIFTLKHSIHVVATSPIWFSQENPSKKSLKSKGENSYSRVGFELCWGTSIRMYLVNYNPTHLIKRVRPLNANPLL
jgi:hypothetical protein